ncbi:putative hydrolase of the HAD superfamily [Sinobacterium caligoides]|uniref:Putative hydrolase of the HAD superfamily n=1 Tax=Sinobacterium caligoides TaxID=933926 RepID=A0A3N2DDM9_9GAMM|nr:HAD family hydrolase [Sinobacterium caligoides]ROR97901.1 putative hydrolase of the HAD superfamily [Sinobacterium caligoides]
MHKAIFFDLDNTLVHRNKSISVYSKCFIASYADSLKSVSSEDIAAVICSQDRGGYLSENSPYSTIKEAVSNELHKRFVRSKKLTVEDILGHWLQNFPLCAQPMSRANELLAQLSAQGYHIGIISNGADKTRLATAKTLGAFDSIKQLVSSEAAGIKKPNSAIFTQSANAFGLSPDQCWYIGDHPVNDIDGARKAGMQAIWLRGFHDWPAHIDKPRHAITCLSEVTGVLASSPNKLRQSET